MLAAAIGSAAWTVSRHKKNASTDEKQKTKAAAPKAEDEPAAMLAMDELRIEIGYALLTLVNAEGGSPRLTDQIRAVRRAIAQELGFVTPPVRIVDNMQLKPQGYVIRLKEQEIARGDVRPGSFLVMDPSGKRLDLLGEPTREPAFGLDAMWVDASQREAASLKGFTVVDAATVLTTHLTEIIKSSAPELLSYAETKKLIDALPDKHKNPVSDLVPNVVSVAVVQRVLQNLLAERVSIRDLPTILEAIAEFGASRQCRIDRRACARAPRPPDLRRPQRPRRLGRHHHALEPVGARIRRRSHRRRGQSPALPRPVKASGIRGGGHAQARNSGGRRRSSRHRDERPRAAVRPLGPRTGAGPDDGAFAKRNSPPY